MTFFQKRIKAMGDNVTFYTHEYLEREAANRMKSLQHQYDSIKVELRDNALRLREIRKSRWYRLGRLLRLCP